MITDAAVAYYEDEDDTTDVEIFEEVANDVYVDGATEQARKCFALERRRGGSAIPNLSILYSCLFTLYLTC